MLFLVDDRTVTELPAVRFADVARRLGAAAHEAGLDVPAFRSPPRVAGADRTIRRYPAGSVVSVRLRGRPFADVVADMVDGVLAANRVGGADAAQLRHRLAATLPGAPTATSDSSAAPAAASTADGTTTARAA
jgi:hypothetical protein